MSTSGRDEALEGGVLVGVAQLAELATLTRNTIRLPGIAATFNKLATPTPTQARALELTETAEVLT